MPPAGSRGRVGCFRHSRRVPHHRGDLNRRDLHSDVVAEPGDGLWRHHLLVDRSRPAQAHVVPVGGGAVLSAVSSRGPRGVEGRRPLASLTGDGGCDELREATGWAARDRLRRTAWVGGIATAAVIVWIVDRTAEVYPPVAAMTERSTARDAMASAAGLVEERRGAPTTTVAASATSTDPPTPTSPPSVSTPPPQYRPLRVLVGAVANAGVLGCGVLVRTPGWMVDNPTRGGLVDGSYAVASVPLRQRRSSDCQPVPTGWSSLPAVTSSPTGTGRPMVTWFPPTAPSCEPR